MPKACFTCNVVTSEDVPTLSCGACRSAVYCSKVCQKKYWKDHKKICKSLNVGEGAMQLQRPGLEGNAVQLKEIFNARDRTLDENGKRFFKLFTQSTFE
jgi:hypothetical protein